MKKMYVMVIMDKLFKILILELSSINFRIIVLWRILAQTERLIFDTGEGIGSRFLESGETLTFNIVSSVCPGDEQTDGSRVLPGSLFANTI